MPIIRYDSTKNLQTGDNSLKTTSFNASNTTFNIRLDPLGVTRPGVYAVVKSTGITNPASPIANSFYDPPNYLNIKSTTRSNGIICSDGTFDTVLVRVG